MNKNLSGWQKRMMQAFDAKPEYSGHGGKARFARDLGIEPSRMAVYFVKPVEQPRGDFLKSVAQRLDVGLDWLRDGHEGGKITVKVIGEVGAGEHWVPYSEDSIELIDVDFDLTQPVAVRVRGDSMKPVYRSGDKLVASQGGDSPHKRDCIVETLDGQRLVKFVLSQGAGFKLVSYNPRYKDREVTGLKAAWPVKLVIRA